MEFTGLSLGQLAALFGVAGVAVTALYLLKLRRRTVVVPFVSLWAKLLADKQSSSLFSRLKRFWSLLLALLLVALLALSLGDPRHSEDSGALRHSVILIDTGITMQAREGNTDRLHIALNHARGLVERMGARDRMLIAPFERTVTPMTPMTSEASQLLAALSKIRATDVQSDVTVGMELARDVLRGRSQPEIILLSDGTSYAGPTFGPGAGIALRHVLVGKSQRDVGISAFAVRRFPLDKTRSELLIELTSSSQRKETVELRLEGDGKPIDVQRIELATTERKRLVYDNITGVDRTLQATLTFADGSHDELRANNRAFATLPERTRTRVLCVTDGNRYLEAALLLDEYLQVDVVAPDAYAESALHDVVIFDRNQPTTLPRIPAIYLAPSVSTQPLGPLRVKGTVTRPFFDRLSRDHALLRHLSLRDVNIASALLVDVNAGDKVVGADSRGPLLVAGVRDQVPFVALTFDVTQSDLPLRVAWPMLLLNALDSFAEQKVGYVDNYRAGERGLLALGQGDHNVSWTAPNGTSLALPVVDNHAVIDVPHAGFYTLHEGDQQRPVAINPGFVDRIEPRALSARVDKADTTAATRTVTREQPWSYLLMAVIAILALEWFTFHRRWTV